MSVIPVGYLTLVEAAGRLREVRSRAAGQQPSDAEQFMDWYTKLGSLIDSANAELQSALESETLEAFVYDRARHQHFRITPSDVREHKRTFALLFYESKISALWTEPLSRHQGEVPLVEKDAFTRWFEAVTGEPWKRSESDPVLGSPAVTDIASPYRGYSGQDEPLVLEGLRLIKEKRISVPTVASELARRAVGGGTEASKAKRLEKRLHAAMRQAKASKRP